MPGYNNSCVLRAIVHCPFLGWVSYDVTYESGSALTSLLPGVPSWGLVQTAMSRYYNLRVSNPSGSDAVDVSYTGGSGMKPLISIGIPPPGNASWRPGVDPNDPYTCASVQLFGPSKNTEFHFTPTSSCFCDQQTRGGCNYVVGVSCPGIPYWHPTCQYYLTATTKSTALIQLPDAQPIFHKVSGGAGYYRYFSFDASLLIASGTNLTVSAAVQGIGGSKIQLLATNAAGALPAANGNVWYPSGSSPSSATNSGFWNSNATGPIGGSAVLYISGSDPAFENCVPSAQSTPSCSSIVSIAVYGAASSGTGDIPFTITANTDTGTPIRLSLAQPSLPITINYRDSQNFVVFLSSTGSDLIIEPTIMMGLAAFTVDPFDSSAYCTIGRAPVRVIECTGLWSTATGDPIRIQASNPCINSNSSLAVPCNATTAWRTGPYFISVISIWSPTIFMMTATQPGMVTVLEDSEPQTATTSHDSPAYFSYAVAPGASAATIASRKVAKQQREAQDRAKREQGYRPMWADADDAEGSVDEGISLRMSERDHGSPYPPSIQAGLLETAAGPYPVSFTVTSTSYALTYYISSCAFSACTNASMYPGPNSDPGIVLLTGQVPTKSTVTVTINPGSSSSSPAYCDPASDVNGCLYFISVYPPPTCNVATCAAGLQVVAALVTGTNPVQVPWSDINGQVAVLGGSIPPPSDTAASSREKSTLGGAQSVASDASGTEATSSSSSSSSLAPVTFYLSPNTVAGTPVDLRFTLDACGPLPTPGSSVGGVSDVPLTATDPSSSLPSSTSAAGSATGMPALFVCDPSIAAALGGCANAFTPGPGPAGSTAYISTLSSSAGGSKNGRAVLNIPQTSASVMYAALGDAAILTPSAVKSGEGVESKRSGSSSLPLPAYQLQVSTMGSAPYLVAGNGATSPSVSTYVTTSNDGTGTYTTYLSLGISWKPAQIVAFDGSTPNITAIGAVYDLYISIGGFGWWAVPGTSCGLDMWASVSPSAVGPSGDKSASHLSGDDAQTLTIRTDAVRSSITSDVPSNGYVFRNLSVTAVVVSNVPITLPPSGDPLLLQINVVAICDEACWQASMPNAYNSSSGGTFSGTTQRAAYLLASVNISGSGGGGGGNDGSDWEMFLTAGVGTAAAFMVLAGAVVLGRRKGWLCGSGGYRRVPGNAGLLVIPDDERDGNNADGDTSGHNYISVGDGEAGASAAAHHVSGRESRMDMLRGSVVTPSLSGFSASQTASPPLMSLNAVRAGANSTGGGQASRTNSTLLGSSGQGIQPSPMLRSITPANAISTAQSSSAASGYAPPTLQPPASSPPLMSLTQAGTGRASPAPLR